MESKTKKWEKSKNYRTKTDMFISIGRQSGESVESVIKKRKVYGEKDLQKKRVKPGMKE